jgi:enoyl-CoA hydratase
MPERETNTILTEKNGSVTTITINRPEVRNAMDNDTALALASAFKSFDADDEALVAVLTGARGAFCAGADLKKFAEGMPYMAWAGSENGPTRPLLSKPVIAAVAGYACAGGLGVALWCDLRVAEEGAVFAILSRRWGVPHSDGTTFRLPRLIGMSRALDMILTGREVGAKEAFEIGLANRYVPHGKALESAQELAAHIAKFPQISLRSDRKSAYLTSGLPVEEAIRVESECAAEAKKLSHEGSQRFAEGAGRHGNLDQ